MSRDKGLGGRGILTDAYYDEPLFEDQVGTEEKLHRVLALLQRNAVWIAAIVGVFVLASVLMAMLTEPRYRATSKVLIEQQAAQIIEGSETQPTTGYQDADRFLETQVDVIGSRGLASRVVQAGNLGSDPRFFEAMRARMPVAGDVAPGGANVLNEKRRKAAVNLLQRNLETKLPKNSRVVLLTFESSDPAVAAKIANLLAENYIEANLNRKFESSSYARTFLAQQLQEARAKLEQSEVDLNKYSRQAGLIRVQVQGADATGETSLSVTNDSLVQINSAASQATADRMAAQDRWEAIKSEPVLSVPQVIANPSIQGLIQQRSTTEGALAQERARHLADHPNVQALEAQLSRLSAQIERTGAAIKRSVFLEFDAARKKQASITERVEALRAAALNEQDERVQLAILKRVADTNRASYDSLLERFNKLSASAGSAANNVSLVDRAEVPDAPSSPNLVLNVMLAFIGGLFTAILFVFVRDHFDDVIRAPTDVEAKLGLPLLGLIPRSDVGGLGDALSDRKSDVSEGYSTLVANLTYATPKGLPRSIMVTSAHASEGKSTSALAVAANLGRLGKSVLLIDADLRRPTLHHTLSNEANLGLTDVLTSQARIGEVIQSTPDLPYSYIFAGAKPPEPSLLLGGAQLSAALAEAQSRFDVVIVDAPPMLGLSDSAILAAQVDAVLLVIDSTQAHRGAVKSTLRRLQLVKAPIVGAVLTKFDPKEAGGSYSYYGASYYKYGNGPAS